MYHFPRKGFIVQSLGELSPLSIVHHDDAAETVQARVLIAAVAVAAGDNVRP
jgi:hypothetical protein